ncbi:tubulin-like doman-containing protein [Sandarakinorhabdus sp.]|uniref:tubulin-like doman-containing protein n=1 Tax=Sandarakinorhabdus sp. TaxID=1916663 RepID=UPI003F702B17
MASKAPKQPTILPVRPTVFIGLGGTGMEVLLRLRRRILAERWNGRQLASLDEFPVASFLYFDTDSRPTSQSGIDPDKDPYHNLIKLDGEAIRPDNFNPGKYQAQIRNFPLLESWLPSAQLSGIDTSKGAGQVRSLSRLLFFDRIREFNQQVRRRMSSVSDNTGNRRKLELLGLQPSTDVRAVVVAGLGGGTGAGTFIDVGLFLRSITGPDLKEVDAYLTLPSGYRKYQERTLANGFAALSELEHVMRKRKPPYVTEWGTSSAIHRVSSNPDRQRPYDDIYLFDTANETGNHTSDINVIYDMMSDALLEDFATTGFGERKRSSRVNRRGPKDALFVPDALEGDRQLRGLQFSQAYSAVGQSRLTTRSALAVDEATEVATQKMLSSFFGVALDGEGRRASAPDRDVFLREVLCLEDHFYDDFPDHLRPKPRAVAVSALVEKVLSQGDRTLDSQLIEDVQIAFADIPRQLATPDDWQVRARDLAAQFKADVIPQAGIVAKRLSAVADHRHKLERLWFADDPEHNSGSLLSALFTRIDDRARGGVDLAFSLVQDVRQDLERDGGRISTLLAAAEELDRVAETLHDKQFNAALDGLSKALKGGLLGKPDLKNADTYLKHAGVCLAQGLAFRIRARAAREAVDLLRKTIIHLGRQEASDQEQQYSGLLGKLHGYRQAVAALAQDATRERDKIRDRALSNNSGTALVIDDDENDKAFKLVEAEAARWADDLFDARGKARGLLPDLVDGQGRADVLTALRAGARERLQPLANALPSITEVLSRMAPADAAAHLRQLMSGAMPWVLPSSMSTFSPRPDQYEMLLATGDKDAFQRAFGSSVNSLAPAKVTPEILAAGEASELICYCELSGFPLDWLAGMRDSWRYEYIENISGRVNNPYPIHTHRDYTHFAMPVVPEQAEIDRLRSDLTLFLKATMIGRLERSADGDWKVSVARPGKPRNLLAIGTEAQIRRSEIAPNLRREIQTQIAEFEADAGPGLLSAAAKLAEFFAWTIYTPIKTRLDGQNELEIYGFGHKQSLEIHAYWLKLRSERAPGQEDQFDKWDEKLGDDFDTWSSSVAGSGSDAPRDETNAIADRRSLKRDWQNEAAFADLLYLHQAPPSAPDGPPPPPPPPSQSAEKWWLAADGQTTGPFTRDALVHRLGSGFGADSQVCPVGSSSWQTAASVISLADLFPPPPPKS